MQSFVEQGGVTKVRWIYECLMFNANRPRASLVSKICNIRPPAP
jgi:hypothetical protein